MSSAPTWKAEFVRLTSLFAQRTPKRGLFEEVLGRPEDTVNEDRRQAQMQESGMFEGMVLTCLSGPNRVDWLLSPPPQTDPYDQMIPLEMGLELMSQIATKSFELGETPTRLALGAVLKAEVLTRETGYAMLGVLLPSVKLDPSSEDFSYQINRPKESEALPGRKINRLSKWSVAMTQQILLQGIPVAPVGPALKPHFSCRLELDINNADGDAIPTAQLAPLWREFSEMTRDIAANGDIP